MAAFKTILVLKILALLQLGVSELFDEDHIGAVFEPYTKFGPRSQPYSREEVADMLNLVSTRFRKLSTFGMGTKGPQGTLEDADAAGFIPLLAASYNRAHNLSFPLEVTIGTWKHDNPATFQRELELAFEAAETANRKFSKTVTGIIIANVQGVYHDIHYWLSLFSKYKERARQLDLDLGMRTFDCGPGPNKRDEIMILEAIDFVICLKVIKSQRNEDSAAMGETFENIYQHFRSIKPSLKVWFELGWQTSDNQVTSYNAFSKFWKGMIKWAKTNDRRVDFFTAFDEPWKEIDIGRGEGSTGLWKRIRNDTSSAEAFLEKFTLHDKKAYPVLGIVLGVCGVVFVILITFLLYYRFRLHVVKNQLLSQKDINNFLNGCESTDGEDALKLPYDKAYEIPRGNIIIDSRELIGKGAFGTVYKGKVNGENEEVAVKMTHANLTTASNLKSLLNEIKIMIHVGRHPFVVSIVGAYTGELRKGVVIIATEFCSGGSFEDYLRMKKKSMSLQSNGEENNYANNPNEEDEKTLMENLIKWSYQIATGMEYIASKKVVHADLASRNVLLTADGNVKITDFGLSRRLYEYTNYVKQNQEPLPWRWMAIESLQHMTFNTQSDVWSYGVLLWEIFSLGDVPYPGISWQVSFAEDLVKGLRLQRPFLATTEIYSTMLDCWKHHPEDRPTFGSLGAWFLNLSIRSSVESEIDHNYDNMPEHTALLP